MQFVQAFICSDNEAQHVKRVQDSHNDSRHRTDVAASGTSIRVERYRQGGVQTVELIHHVTRAEEVEETCIFMKCTYIKNPEQKKHVMKNADDV